MPSEEHPQQSDAERFSRGFQRVYRHRSFKQIVALLKRGVDSFEAYNKLTEHMCRIRKDVPGSFFPYHHKLVLDVLVMMNWVPACWVDWYPVSKTAATAVGLRDVFDSNTQGEAELSEMLSELTHRLCREGKDFQSDFHGTVGANLCWLQRRSRKGVRQESRYADVLHRWSGELHEIRRAGLAV